MKAHADEELALVIRSAVASLVLLALFTFFLPLLPWWMAIAPLWFSISIICIGRFIGQA